MPVAEFQITDRPVGTHQKVSAIEQTREPAEKSGLVTAVEAELVPAGSWIRLRVRLRCGGGGGFRRLLVILVVVCWVVAGVARLS